MQVISLHNWGKQGIDLQMFVGNKLIDTKNPSCDKYKLENTFKINEWFP